MRCCDGGSAAQEDPPPAGVFFQQETGIAEDESYGEDEKALNTFLKLHPMLSAEASSVKTLASVANLFQKAAVQVGDLPVVTKTHDDLFLRPANVPIGERPCINDDRCIAKFLAQVRFGADSPKAFTCTEFLLPDVHKRFLDGRGLPPRRSKCILCYRYFTTFLYTAARADPSFRAIDASGMRRGYRKQDHKCSVCYRKSSTNSPIFHPNKMAMSTRVTSTSHQFFVTRFNSSALSCFKIFR